MKLPEIKFDKPLPKPYTHIIEIHVTKVSKTKKKKLDERYNVFDLDYDFIENLKFFLNDYLGVFGRDYICFFGQNWYVINYCDKKGNLKSLYVIYVSDCDEEYDPDKDNGEWIVTKLTVDNEEQKNKLWFDFAVEKVIRKDRE